MNNLIENFVDIIMVYYHKFNIFHSDILISLLYEYNLLGLSFILIVQNIPKTIELRKNEY